MKRFSILCLICLVFSCEQKTSYRDVSFFSDAFQTERWYRIYLPEGYDQNEDTRYPVVYYFHGWGGRYKWDNYDLEDDVHYPGNGRKEPPFVMEWQNYARDNQLIIVSWDGYEPNLHKGKKMREGIEYGNSSPYDYVRAHEDEDHHWGWDFRPYFRDLVHHVDQNFRTKADRDHRGITGLSMGGQTAYYIAGQNKDLVSSVSAFDPADNYPLYGPKGTQAVLPILQMYRPLKGLAVRLTITDGDWLKYNDWRLDQMFKAADLTSYEVHIADYPDHWAADIDQQLDFHRKAFSRPPSLPENWHHVDPAFPSFEVWGYQINVQRDEPALTLVEDVSPGQLKILARNFIPEGPIVGNERVGVSTAKLYSPERPYELLSYNLSTEEIKSVNIIASPEGKLVFSLPGGGHLVGINGEGPGLGPKIRMGFDHNQEYFYFEEGKAGSLNFKLVNLGAEMAENVEITASSDHPFIVFKEQTIQVPSVKSGDFIQLEEQFDFLFQDYSDSSFVGNLTFEIRVDGNLQDTQQILIFPTPESAYVGEEDIIVLDGGTRKGVPIYQQGPNVIEQTELSGGEGNGNGKLEPGEKALVYLRLPQGMGPNDKNTFHRTYLLNQFDDPYINVQELDYREKSRQAGATSVASVISLSEDAPKNYELDLWFIVESLYNDKEDTTSNATIYAHKYDYRRAKIKVH